MSQSTDCQRTTEVASIIDRNMRLGRSPLASRPLTAVRYVLPHARTTLPERFLLLMIILLLPLETHIPTVAGFTTSFFMFAVLAGYVIVNRPHILDRIWRHPVFIAGYAFIGISFFLELASPLPLYEQSFRFGLMIAGAILVASLCRDRLALRACLYGYIGAALWLAVVVCLTSYGALSDVATTDFDEASKIRADVFSHKPVRGNINAMSYICMQGGAVAFALTLASSSPLRRMLFFAMALFCVLGSFLTMSRSTIAVSILSCAAILYAYGFRHGKALVLGAVFAMCLFLLIPDVMWSRMAVQANDGMEESRIAIYMTALQSLPEYLISGVGAGNFINMWGFKNGFGAGDHVYSLHNMFLEVLVFWGLIGLLPFIVLIWQAYRCLPERCGRDVLALGILGIAVSQFLMMPFYSDIYSKWLSLCLGMLVASRCWIWPSGIVQPVKPGSGLI